MQDHLPPAHLEKLIARLDALIAVGDTQPLAGILITASSIPWATYWNDYHDLHTLPHMPDRARPTHDPDPILHALTLPAGARQAGGGPTWLNILILPWEHEATLDEPTEPHTPGTPTGQLAYRAWRHSHTLYPRTTRALPIGTTDLTRHLTTGRIDLTSLTIQTTLLTPRQPPHAFDINIEQGAYDAIADLWETTLTSSALYVA